MGSSAIRGVAVRLCPQGVNVHTKRSLAMGTRAVENREVPNLDHVRWVGGGSGAGKTTVARSIAERFGLEFYSTDSTLSVHSERLGPTEAPLLKQFRQMSLDERWVQRDPTTMYATFPWFHGEGFELLVEDLHSMPTNRPLLVEGFRLIPHLVRPLVSDPKHAAWLVPTPEFRLATFSQRQGFDAFWERTSDPEQALSNLLERDRIFTDEIALDARQHQFKVIRVDSTQTVDDVVIELVSLFEVDYPITPGR